MPTTLAEWLDHQQRVHPHAIELGLDRVREVWTRLGAPAPAPVVITVGGTNGKGSTVAFLEAMLHAAGQRVGAFTSPHLLRYNERVRVAGREVDDAALIDAFERIEAARADSIQPIPLTYFEFGTLAALWIFSQRRTRRRRARSRPRRSPRRGQYHRRRCGDRDHGRSRSPGLARQRSRQHRPREGRHLPRGRAGDRRRRRSAAHAARNTRSASVRNCAWSVAISASHASWTAGAGRVGRRTRTATPRPMPRPACCCPHPRWPRRARSTTPRPRWPRCTRCARGSAGTRARWAPASPTPTSARACSASPARPNSSSTSDTIRRRRVCWRPGCASRRRRDVPWRCSARWATRMCRA